MLAAQSTVSLADVYGAESASDSTAIAAVLKVVLMHKCPPMLVLSFVLVCEVRQRMPRVLERAVACRALVSRGTRGCVGRSAGAEATLG